MVNFSILFILSLFKTQELFVEVGSLPALSSIDFYSLESFDEYYSEAGNTVSHHELLEGNRRQRELLENMLNEIRDRYSELN
jgi:hypothetical protein